MVYPILFLGSSEPTVEVVVVSVFGAATAVVVSLLQDIEATKIKSNKCLKNIFSRLFSKFLGIGIE
jgi:hypothetical protein